MLGNVPLTDVQCEGIDLIDSKERCQKFLSIRSELKIGIIVPN